MKSLMKPLLLVMGATFMAALGTTPLMAQTLDDPLHGVCFSPTAACTDNGTVTPTGSNQPNFGFTISPGPQTGDFLIVVLVPNNDTISNFMVTGTQGGTANTSLISANATLFSSTAFTSGDLGTYLGLTSSPANPIGGFLPTTNKFDAGATGYFVYVADLGQTKVSANGGASAGPKLTITTSLPNGASIVSFLKPATGGTTVATALSGQLSIEGAQTPEPTSMLLMGSGLLGLGGVLRRRKKRNLA